MRPLSGREDELGGLRRAAALRLEPLELTDALLILLEPLLEVVDLLPQRLFSPFQKKTHPYCSVHVLITDMEMAGRSGGFAAPTRLPATNMHLNIFSSQDFA